MENTNTKTKMSWGTLFLIVSIAALFLIGLTNVSGKITQGSNQQENEEQEQIAVASKVGDYVFENGILTEYNGTDSEVNIPSTYSLGEVIKTSGTKTFENQSEAYSFYSTYLVNYDDNAYENFYVKIGSQSYPWKYEYSFETQTFVEGNDYEVTAIGSSAFYQNKNIEKIYIPNTITSIGNYAFEYCSNLKEIVFNEGLKEIGDSAFWGCKIEYLNNLPTTLEDIYPYAFFDCTNLLEVTIPENVRCMYLGTFNNCVNLTKVTIKSDYEIEAWGTEVYQTFSNCSNLKVIYIPVDMYDYYTTTEPWNLYFELYKTI